MSFLTNGIVPYEATLTDQPEVKSAIQYYDTPDSPTKFTTFYVSELIASIISSCNTNITMQVPCTVIEINENILSTDGVKYSFPVNDISIWPSNSGNGVNSFIKYKNNKYYVIETVSQLVTASNIGGGGGSDKNIIGIKRFVQRFTNWMQKEGTETIDLSKFKKQIFDYTESFKFNKVVSSFMILFNENKNKALNVSCKNEIIDLLQLYMPSIRKKLLGL